MVPVRLGRFRVLLGLVIVSSAMVRFLRWKRPQYDATVISNLQGSDSSSSWRRYWSNRTIALIHIGKAGGLTLRAMTSLNCRLPRNPVRTLESMDRCLRETLGTPSSWEDRPLALQTMYYAHMRSIPRDEMEAATSWLLALRNPLDRLRSAFQYSHPANCRDTILRPNSTKACTNFFLLQKNHSTNRSPRRKRDREQLVRLFRDCFPTADWQVFASSVLRQDFCSRLARTYLLGQGPVFPIPHFYYNYRHYQTKVWNVYDTPNSKEWFGIRTEHLWEDFHRLNQQLGGSSLETTTTKITHGSEQYQSASQTMSPGTYEGMCCLLLDELGIYLGLVKRIWNWNESQKATTFQELAHRCGMIQAGSQTEAMSWDWNSLWDAWEEWKDQKCGPFL